jgi:hypothetical protein
MFTLTFCPSGSMSKATSTALAGHSGKQFIAEPDGRGEFRREGVKGVGQPAIGLGFENDLSGIGDRHAILLPGKRRPCSPIRLQSDSKVTPGSAG